MPPRKSKDVPPEISDEVSVIPKPDADLGPGLDNPFREPADAPPLPHPLLSVHAQLPFVLRDSSVDLDGQAEVTWGQGKIPGTASIRIVLRVPVQTYDQAIHLDGILHGALALYEARELASGQHVQRTQFESGLTWRAAEMGDVGEVGIPTTWTADPSSMTVMVSEGVCTLTVATKFSVPIGDIARVDGLSRRRVHLTATAAQLSLVD